MLGISLVVVGALCNLLAFLHYKRTAKQLDAGTYTAAAPLTTVLMLVLLFMSVLLIGYLLITT